MCGIGMLLLLQDKTVGGDMQQCGMEAPGCKYCKGMESMEAVAAMMSLLHEDREDEMLIFCGSSSFIIIVGFLFEYLKVFQKE